MKTAAQLSYGEKVIINNINGDHPSSRRILEMGFTPGQEIELIHKSVFSDPLAFAVRGAMVAIRKDEADSIQVV